MKRVYAAANLADAHIVAGALAGRGVRVRILNAHAAGAIGELPVDAAAPQLWVDDDADAPRALAAIEAFRHAAAGEPRRCAACGEENPAAFEVCWACGAGLPP